MLIGHANRPDVYLNLVAQNDILTVQWMSVPCVFEQLSLVVGNTAPQNQHLLETNKPKTKTGS